MKFRAKSCKIVQDRAKSCKIMQNRAAKVKTIQKRASQGFLDPIQKRALSRSVQLEAVYLEALLYLKKAPKSHFAPIYLVMLVWFTYHPVGGAQRQKNKKNVN